MFIFNTYIYKELSNAIAERIVSNSLTLITIELLIEPVTIKFTSSLFAELSTLELIEGRCVVISDIIPIWWEVRTTEDNIEITNDFDFSLLKYHICHT